MKKACWGAGASLSQREATHNQLLALTDRKVQGTTSQGATVTSARGSGQGKIPEEVIFLRITAEEFTLFYLVSRTGPV